MIEKIKKLFRDDEVSTDVFGRDDRISTFDQKDLIHYFLLFAFGTAFPPFAWGYILFEKHDRKKWKGQDMFNDEKKAVFIDRILVCFTTFISCPIFYLFVL